MVVAEKLGLTLNELQEKMTPAELHLWGLFYELRRDKEKAAMEGARRRR